MIFRRLWDWLCRLFLGPICAMCQKRRTTDPNHICDDCWTRFYQ